ncbi:MAG: hypothetical protein U0929_11635 [Planctomycetaceae bacterium]
MAALLFRRSLRAAHFIGARCGLGLPWRWAGVSRGIVVAAILCGFTLSNLAVAGEPGTAGTASQAAPLKLVAREFADFEHHFTTEELGTGIPVSVEGLPEGATYDPATRVLKWCPPEGATGGELVLKPAEKDQVAASLPRVQLTVQQAYQPPIHLVPQAFPKQGEKHPAQALQEAVRSILEYEVPAKSMPKRFEALDKHVRKIQSAYGEDPRFEVARALRIIRAGALTLSDQRSAIDSLNRAVEKAGSPYLEAHSLRLWMWIRMNDLPKAIETLPAYSGVLRAKTAASREEVLFRCHELGLLIGFMQEKARGAQVTTLAKSREELLQAFAKDPDGLQAIHDGMNRIRASLHEEKLALNEMHENKLKENEKKQQESAEKQAQLTKDISAADTAYQDIEKKWREEVAPLDAVLSPLQDKWNQLSEQYRDLLSDLEIAQTNIQLNGIDSNGNLINPQSSTFLQTLQSRCVEIQEKINKKKVEIAQLEKEMSPLVAKRKAVDQKWNKTRSVAGGEMKKLRRNLGRTSRQVSGKEGKPAAPARFEPSLADFVPVDFDFQRSYLLESFATGQK